jgi:hypothetical protein
MQCGTLFVKRQGKLKKTINTKYPNMVNKIATVIFLPVGLKSSIIDIMQSFYLSVKKVNVKQRTIIEDLA